MNSLSKNFSIGSYVNLLHRRLVRNLVLLGLGMIGLAMSTTLYFDKRLVDSLSRQLIQKSAYAIEQQLKGFFEPIERNLRIAQRQLESADWQDPAFAQRLFTRMSPFVKEYRRVSALIVADMQGNEHFLLEQDDEFLTRHIDVERGGKHQAHWRRWKGDQVIETWQRQTDYDPHSRPWFRNAIEAELDSINWTEPYIFYTTKALGITVSSKWKRPDTGDVFVTAFDVNLSDLSRYTMTLQPSERGEALIVLDDKRVLGLPWNEQSSDKRALSSRILSLVSKLNIPEVSECFTEWERLQRSTDIFRFTSNGEAWWAGFLAHQYTTRGDTRHLWVSVLIPETDFLAQIARRRNWVLSGILGVGLLIAAVMILSTIRAVRRNLHTAVSQIERQLGQYQLKYKIGDGGNGAVYRAQHALLRRPTAIKLMHPEYAQSDTAKARFEHEVQIMSSLTHPNTAAVYDFGRTPEGTLYYAMEYLTGITLEELVQSKGPQPAERVIYILEQVCGSLSEAHGKGLIHRDIKPANIMLCERGGMFDVVKVLDFGLVKEMHGPEAHLTQANVLVGTPLYLAPELISTAERASPQSDIYALGAMGYFLLTGSNVFEGSGTVEICAAHLHAPPIPPSQRIGHPIPEDLENIILVCLAKRPEQRPESAMALAESLHRCQAYGQWTSATARAWWFDHRESLPLDADQKTHTPMSDTQLLVDLDERSKAIQGVANQPAAIG